MNNEIVSGVARENSLGSTAVVGVNGRSKRVSDRLGRDGGDTTVCPEESLVIDDRCDLSPAALVESKLSRMLGGAMLPVSHLQTRGLLRQR